MTRIFQRLVGLETEYAIRYQPAERIGAAPSKFRLFESIVSALRRQTPTVPARYFKEGVFTANGGAVWFEAERPSAGGGLIEGATPECRGPRQTLAYQMAQDKTLEQCAQKSHHGLTLIKNDRDAEDNIYGAQENYEVTLATGWRLWLWRLGLVLLFPLALLTWCSILGCVLVTLAYFLIAGLFYIPLRFLTGRHEKLTLHLFGRDISEGRETCVHLPAWLEMTLQGTTRVLTAPLAISLFLLLRVTAFTSVCGRLLPFLVSRAVISGAGMIDKEGKFHIADKGPAINCTYGFGGILWDRPIFTFGHFFKAIYAESWFSPREYAGLFSREQRLQIAIGDSNMCPTAQFLRVGTTLLVLDAIDAGFFGYHPRLKSPIRALRAICADPTLQAQVPLHGEPPATAIQLQRFYYSACRAFVGSHSDSPCEAYEVLDLWKRSLDELEHQADEAREPKWLVGSLDWVTKKYLMDHAGAQLNWAQRKKIDIRYHELAPDGYFALLEKAGLVHSLLDEEQIQRAQRTPPPNTPATTRGHYIREFGSGDEPLTANWKTIVLGRGWGARVIRLKQYGQKMAAPSRLRGMHRDARDKRSRRWKKG